MSCTSAVGTILGTSIAVTNRSQATRDILALSLTGKPAHVCFATAHMLVEAAQNPRLRNVYERASIVAPDGRPVAWALRLTGHRRATCVSGPQLVPELLEAASRSGISVGFYGGRPETLRRVVESVTAQFPGLQVAYSYSPPFRELTPHEAEQVRQDIRASGARLVFVGLGSPKQELWIEQNTVDLPCVLLGVGAVFEFLSGEKVLPPVWVQNLGLMWLARLCQEPRRLLRRNLVYSPLFVMRFIREHVLAIRQPEG
jgi:N-acetylglucosaminyldiphosphoundecaprenol N-acetyl-beta-D-mannosaminyltransferase